jgi:hypothetical protein
MYHYHVRFNLDRRSDRFKQWQVKEVCRHGNVVFHVDPAVYSIVMRHCRLVNKPRIAQKVFDSQSRDVAGWIECDTFDLVKPVSVEDKVMVLYDPKVNTHWHFDGELDSIDGRKFKELVTQGRRVYAPMREVALCY